MTNLYLAFSVVFPLFCMMALGYFLSVIKLFNDDFLKSLNNLCFKVFLPVLLFTSIYDSDFTQLTSPLIIIYSFVCVLVTFVMLMVIVPRFDKLNINRGVIVQGFFRGNFILFGIPITVSLYGADNTSIAAILIAFTVPLFNLLSIVALETFSDKKTSFKSIVAGVFKNPLILGALVAFFFIITNIEIPTIIYSTVTDISKIGTPLALIILGGSFQFNDLGLYLKPLIVSVFGKLVLIPAIFISISILLGFRDIQLVALLGLFASPTSVSSYTMAQSVGANDKLAGQIVVIGSSFSVITIFGWITVLRVFEFI